jgi:hypothetical protein
LMLDWEAVTLTHSSVGAVLPLVLALAEVVASSVTAAEVDDCADGDVVWSGSALTLVTAGAAVCALLAAAVAALELLADGLGEGDGDGEGDAEGEGDGEGVGVAVTGEGSAWHAVSVFAAGAACAVSSAPRVRKLPLSKVTAATLTYAKRIRMACLRCSSGLPCAVRDSEATRGQMGTVTHFREQATYASPSFGSQPWLVYRRLYSRQQGSDGLRGRSVP